MAIPAISSLRKEYTQRGLRRADLDCDPITQFSRWFGDALAAEIPDVNAMTLATATRDGAPSSRIVLLKSFDARGFVFFTNYESRKGRELGENPRVALTFYWVALERQIGIQGSVEKTTQEESEEYFKSRPLGSRLGAWASEQSAPIGSRDELERRLATVTEKYAGDEIPLPPHWGGFRIRPSRIEFWQGRPNRLHDRFQYEQTSEGSWHIERLSP